jgi:hypothetical protein
MSREHADELQDIIESGDQWPLAHEAPVLRQIREWNALAESHSETLQEICGWQQGDNQYLPYVIDPIAERIKDAFADLIFGAETEFEAATKTDEESVDQPLLDDIVDENELQSELQAAASLCVAEGEVWWRVLVDNDAWEHPVLEWHSRASVIPLYRGRKVLAAAFVSTVDNLAPEAPVIRVGDDSDPPGTRMWRENASTQNADDDNVWRYIEIQTGGLVRNLLYRGTKSTLGQRQSLSSLPEFADLNDEWEHGLEIDARAGRPQPVMLAGRITNGKSGRLGRSQYAGIKWLLYELNKVSSIGSRNVELTMQKRAVLPSETVGRMNPDTTTDPDDVNRHRESVALPDGFMVQRDAMGENVMGVLEFSDDWAAALRAWKEGLTDDVLTRARVAPQLVGRHTQNAETGPALRARLLDSVLAADGKARVWDDSLPRIMRILQMVDALPEERGGCGNPWRNPEATPAIVRTSILPEDEAEEATRHGLLVGAKLESRQTAIGKLNPEWNDQRVQEELKLIDDDPINQFDLTGAPLSPGNGATQSGRNGAGPQPAQVRGRFPTPPGVTRTVNG